MSTCTSGCLTRDHETWGDCLRAKSLRVGYAASSRGMDLTKEKRWQAEIDGYRNAVAQGMDPDGSTAAKVRKAEVWSEKTGIAYSPENVKKHLSEKAFGKGSEVASIFVGSGE